MEWLLDTALTTEGIYMHSPIPLTSKKALDTAIVGFLFSPEPPANTATAHACLYSADYVPSSPVLLRTAVESFPANLLGSHAIDGAKPASTGFREWFVSRTTITPEESLLHHDGVNVIWAKFQSIFTLIGGLVYYEPIFRAFVREILTGLVADNCHWIDLRGALLTPFHATGTGELLPRVEIVRALAEEVAAFKAASLPGTFWGASFIWTTIRSFDADTTRAAMLDCIAAKQRYPDLLAGFDLVGQEDLGRTLHAHLPELLWFRHKCADADVDIPFYFHAGETLGDGSPTDTNLVDALLLGTKRIGHGYSLYKHPRLMQLCRVRGVCLEVCPISNEILRLTSSIMAHTLPALLAHGVPVCLNNDDPGILGQARTGSLSHDYWQVLNAFENVGLEGLGDLARTGVRFGAYPAAEVGVTDCPVVAEKLRLWDAMWEEFCAWVVQEYGQWAEVTE